MAEPKLAPAAGLEDAEVFLSASEDEGAQPQAVTPELLSALVKQVEFYFSDANLPTDKKLLKQIRKDPEGYVPVKLFANFRKVRALSKDVGVITEALRGASLLQLSQDSKRVKRIMPVPEYDISDIQRRTIVVENLPGNPSPTIESVTDMFRIYGRVKLVRICSRESKGKLPSWLTGSCQNMTGQQHAYVEFEEEEGAILAAAALASENDVPDGTVQVRRLLACIAEQRERRSVNGNGSSYGGSSTCGGAAGQSSRKGSRDVSPQPGGGRGHAHAIAAGSRRNSGGGVPYGVAGSTSSYSCGGSSVAGSWGAPCPSASASAGGAAPEPFHPHQAMHSHGHHHPLPAVPYHHGAPYHPYHSYGGAFDGHCGGNSGSTSRRGSAGGAMSPSLAHLPPPPPPPPPPPRRSCDSAPASDLLPPASIPTPTLSARASNVYRPPSKRLSDGYTSTIGSGPGSASAPVSATTSAGGGVPPTSYPCGATSAATSALLIRTLGSSFGSSCGGNSCSVGGTSGTLSTAPGSTVSTPVGAPSSPPIPPSSFMGSSYVCPSTGVTLVAHSPPLSARGSSIGGGRPPVHPPLSAAPPPPPPPPPSAVPSAAASLLAEAIAQAQAERRSSEAGAKAAVAVVAPGTPSCLAPSAATMTTTGSTSVPQTAPVQAAAQVAAPAASRPSGPTAPKFLLDLGSGPVSSLSSSRGSTRTTPSGSASSTSGGGNQQQPTEMAAPPAPAVVVPPSVTRGSGQMVENVEDFINNILARPAARPTPVVAASKAPVSIASGATGQKAVAKPTLTPASSTSSSSSVEAAAAVAGILASTLRRPVNVAGARVPAAKAPEAAPKEPQQAKTQTQQLPSRPAVVHITAIAAIDGEHAERVAMELLDMDLNGQRVDLDLDTHHHGGEFEFSSSSAAPVKQQMASFLRHEPVIPTTEPVVVVATVSAPSGLPPSSPLHEPAPPARASSPASGSSIGHSAGGAAASAPRAPAARPTGASAGGAAPAGRSSGAAPPQPGSKRLSKRDYAMWAAATPGFRAEAASKYGAAGSAAGSPPPSSGVTGASGNGGTMSPGTFHRSSGGSAADGSAHGASAGPIWHVAKGPDGTRGFIGRARPL